MTGPLKTVVCKRCGRHIAWIRTESGNRMPLDPTPDDTGNVFVVASPSGPVGTVASKNRPRPPGVAFKPHFGTCAAMNKPRPEKPARPPAHEPPPTLEMDL